MVEPRQTTAEPATLGVGKAFTVTFSVVGVVAAQAFAFS